MAETDKKNEWGAGLLAIAATVLIGAAIPVILYFMLYKPQVERKEGQKKRLSELDVKWDAEMERGRGLRALRDEGEEVGGKLGELEKRFTGTEVQVALDKLGELVTANKLDLTPEAKVRREKSTIHPTDSKADFPDGLKAVMVIVDCYGKWKDFVNFIAAAESHKEATFVVGELIAEGDKNGKDNHTYSVAIWIVQGRNIEAIGR